MAGHIWILAGLGALAAEMLLPGVYLLWIGLAAAGTGLAILILEPGFGASVAIFLALLAISIGYAIQRRKTQPAPSAVNDPGAAVTGRLATVIAQDGIGLRVRLGDSDWTARVIGDAGSVQVGSTVRVEGIEGTTLQVRTVE